MYFYKQVFGLTFLFKHFDYLEEQESGGEFHYEKYIEKVHKKCEAYTKELEFKNKSWKKQVEDWCIYAMRGLEEIIVCRIPQGYNGFVIHFIKIIDLDKL